MLQSCDFPRYNYGIFPLTIEFLLIPFFAQRVLSLGHDTRNYVCDNAQTASHKLCLRQQ